MKLTDVLISSEHVGDADNCMLHLTSVGLEGVTSVVLHHTITVKSDKVCDNQVKLRYSLCVEQMIIDPPTTYAMLTQSSYFDSPFVHHREQCLSLLPEPVPLHWTTLLLSSP